MEDYLTHLLTGKTEPAWPATLPCGARLAVWGEGLIAIEPADAGLDLLISSGIHGNETAPIELAAQLLQEILAGQLLPKARVLFAFGNPEAMRRNERYLDEDLNRLFGKAAELTGNGPAALRARELEAAALQFFGAPGATRFKLHYDLHTAIRGSRIEKFAIYPYPHEAGFDGEEIKRLGACGISAVLLQAKPSPTFSYFTRRHCGSHGFTVELGKARPFGQNQSVNLDLLESSLRRLLAGDTGLPADTAMPALYRVARELIKHSEQFRLNLAADVENFSSLPLGMVLAEDGEQRFVVEDEGALIVFPNAKVKPGLRAGLLVVPASL